MAVTLAAAKVILSTLGVALFLAKEGPGQLPLFYVLLALVSILLSAAASGVVDRVPKMALGQTAFLGTLLGAAALRLPIALDLPAVSYGVLAIAHFYEIVLDIVFWVVVAAYLDAIELKRGTALIYMALAAGGVAGGCPDQRAVAVRADRGPAAGAARARPDRRRPVRARQAAAAGAARSPPQRGQGAGPDRASCACCPV